MVETPWHANTSVLSNAVGIARSSAGRLTKFPCKLFAKFAYLDTLNSRFVRQLNSRSPIPDMVMLTKESATKSLIEMKFSNLVNVFQLCVVFAIVSLSHSTVYAQKPGEMVVVTVDYETKIESEEVDKVYAGSVHTVIDSNGKWCALQDIKGWIPKRYCLSMQLALEQFSKRIKDNERDFDAWVTRGMIHMQQGKLKLAFRDINESLKINPNRASFWNNRGLVYMRMNQFDLAIKDISYAIKLAPKYANAFNNRGMCYYAKGEFEKAIADYSEAIELRPEYPIFLVNRGVSLHSTGKQRQAMDDFNSALKIRKNIVEAYIGRSNLFLGTGDLARAKDNASEAIRLDAESPEAYNNRGWIRYKTGDFAGGKEDFEKAIELDPEFPKAYSNMGVMLTEMKDYDSALQSLNKAIELDDLSALSYTNRGNAFLGKRQYVQARADFNKALDLAPNDTEALNGKAWFMSTCSKDEYRDGEKAVEMAKEACKGSGMRDWSHVDTLAAAYAETGDFEKAVEYESKAIEIAPKRKQEICKKRLENYKKKKPTRTDGGQQ